MPSQGGDGRQASWLSCCVNLLNTIVGSGLLASPRAMSHMGITLGTLVILWSGAAAAFGLYLQSRCSRYLDRGTASFFALSQITYPNAAILFDAAIAIKCFGVGVSYLIIIGDLMPGVMRGFHPDADSVPFLIDRHFWITVFMLVVIPLSYLRRLDSLKYTSIIALVSIAYLVILVEYHFVKGDTKENRGPIRVFQWAGLVPTLQSFPVVVFAYTCHQNMFSILNEIKDNSPRRILGVITASIGTAAFLYVMVAISGYLSFGNKVAGNIVGMYSPAVASTIGKAAIVILVMFSYPLQVHPCRASADAVLKWRPAGSRGRRQSPNGSPSRTIPLLGGQVPHPSARNDAISEMRFAVLTTIIIIFSYTVAMTVSSLDKVLAYVGSTGSTSISFILPGLFYYKISGPDSHQRLKEDDYDTESEDEEDAEDGAQSNSHWRKTVLRKASLGLAIYGVGVMVLCLGTNIFFSAEGH